MRIKCVQRESVADADHDDHWTIGLYGTDRSELFGWTVVVAAYTVKRDGRFNTGDCDGTGRREPTE